MARAMAVVVAVIAMSLVRIGPQSSAATIPSPILLVTNSASSNPFGAYLGEVLRAEGVNSYQAVQLSTVTSQTLSSYPIVILAETSLTSSQAAMFTSYVSSGGSLIAMRPDSQLAPVFGLGAKSGTISEGYILVDCGTAVGKGIANQTIQFHGKADRYTILGATRIATLYSDVSTATTYPALVTSVHGSGRAVAFTYDLAKSVAYLRQGNPETAGTDADGDGIVRSIDGFVGWVDLDRIQLPQADEQMRLLTNTIMFFSRQVGPVPRVWYFPDAADKSVFVVTSDDHGQSVDQLQGIVDIVQAAGGHATFYIPRWVSLPPANLLAWRDGGHEFGMHPYGHEDGRTLSEGYQFNLDWFTPFFGVAPSDTVRNHQVEWQGWADAASVAAQYGIGMSVDFYFWGDWLRKTNGQCVPVGYTTGSGLPMRFVDQSGNLIPVFQQVTELVDEHMFQGGDVCATLTQSEATTYSEQLMDASASDYYSAIVVQNHTYNGGSDWLANITSHAVTKGFPILSATEWLDFTTARHDAQISQYNWDSTSKELTYHVDSDSSLAILTMMVLATCDESQATHVKVDGSTVTSAPMTVKGFDYVAFGVPGGSHDVQISYGQATTPTATPTATATPTPSWSSLTDSTVADFGACDAGAGLSVTDTSGGELRLASSLEDYFDAALSGSKWAWGTWNGTTYNPAPVGGVLPVQSASGSAWARSSGTFTPRTVEGVASFGNGPWEHFGFADDGLASRYAIFSTFDGSTTLYARTNDGSAEIRTPLNGVTLNAYHSFKVMWSATCVDYYVDGQLAAHHDTSPTDPMYVYLSNNSSNGTLNLDWVRVESYPLTSGVFTSCVKDVGASATWGQLSWVGNATAGTTVTFRTRTSSDRVNWSAWSAAQSGNPGAIASPAGRYLQYALTLSSTSRQVSPEVDSATVTYSTSGPIPTPDLHGRVFLPEVLR